ncbi:MAG TPA: hypothetical protein DIS79_06080 [Bacteroidetes bacterium]|nr:hypothetical protein [Bacteroidota bacterium]
MRDVEMSFMLTKLRPMLLPHSPLALKDLRTGTVNDPLRILVSGCIMGWPVTTDGTDAGLGGSLQALFALPNVVAVPFCPEDTGIGTPRGMPDIHGGDGFDVLDGRARVLDQHGNDLTEMMMYGASKMLEFALEQRVDVAVLTDMSAACGSQVISDGCRLVPDRTYQRGVGVATAMVLRAGIPVLSARDYKTLYAIMRRHNDALPHRDDLRDHHETDWYVSYFGDTSSST